MKFLRGEYIQSEKNYCKVAGILLSVGCIQFLLAVNFAQTQFPGYSSTKDTLSTLGGSVPLVEPSAMVFNLSVIIFGILILIVAYLILKSGGAHIFSVLLAISAAGAIGLALFPQYTGNTHSFFALVAFLFGSLATIFSYRLGLNKPLVVISLVLGVPALVLLLLVIIFRFGGLINPLEIYLGVGGNERFIAFPPILYLIALGGYLTSRGEDWS
jgi:hypothetical membrane protein